MDHLSELIRKVKNRSILKTISGSFQKGICKKQSYYILTSHIILRIENSHNSCFSINVQHMGRNAREVKWHYARPKLSNFWELLCRNGSSWNISEKIHRLGRVMQVKKTYIKWLFHLLNLSRNISKVAILGRPSCK